MHIILRVLPLRILLTVLEWMPQYPATAGSVEAPDPYAAAMAVHLSPYALANAWSVWSGGGRYACGMASRRSGARSRAGMRATQSAPPQVHLVPQPSPDAGTHGYKPWPYATGAVVWLTSVPVPQPHGLP